MDSLYEKNIAELKQIASELNIKNCSYMNKSTLVVLINNKQNGSDCGVDCGAGADSSTNCNIKIFKKPVRKINFKKLYFSSKKVIMDKDTIIKDKDREIKILKEQLSKKNNQETKIKSKIKPILITQEVTDHFLWKVISDNKDKLQESKLFIEYLLSEFGTIQPCNRFDIGNCIEFILSEFLTCIGFKIDELPNARRIDLSINSKYNLSIKYSSIGDITLHNSNSCINKDEHMTDLLLLTTEKLYLITNKELQNQGIDIKNYIKNTGDSLKLKRSILTKLHRIKYPLFINFKLKINKKTCKNRLCSKLFYKGAKQEFLNLNN